MDTILQSPSLRALVVDDNIDAAECAAELLVVSGFHAQAATSGTDALNIVRDESPDVVLLDLAMPRMDGFEVARRIRAMYGPRDKRPLLVAVTGCVFPEDNVKAREAGFDLHLNKPVEPALLVGILKRFEEILAPLHPARSSPAYQQDTQTGRDALRHFGTANE